MENIGRHSRKTVALLLAVLMAMPLLYAPATGYAGGVTLEPASTGDFDAALDLGTALSLGTYEWEYVTAGDYYRLAYVTYAANPVAGTATYANDIKYQQISIFVPAAYVAGIDADGGLVLDHNAAIPNGDGTEAYTASNAPIYFACESPGYSENACSDTTNSTGYLNAGMIVVNVGHRGKGSIIQTVYTGKAPWALVDCKAAIQYLRLNDDLIPGSAERLVSSASSGGGALSGMIGATGDYDAYLPYLYAIGAAGVAWTYATPYTGAGDAIKANLSNYAQSLSNAVYASNLWCPILNVDYSDAAYESFYGPGTRSGNANPFQVALSGILADSFESYVATISGSAYSNFLDNAFTDAIEASANEYLDSIVAGLVTLTWTTPPASASKDDVAAAFIAGTYTGTGGFDKSSWLSYSAGSLSVTNINNCIAAINTGNKAITGFDGLKATMTENQPFGDANNNYKHYSASYFAELLNGTNATALDALFDAFNYAYTVTTTSAVTAGPFTPPLTAPADKRVTTTAYTVTVSGAANITVDKTETVTDVQTGSSGGAGGPGGPGGSRDTVIATLSSVTDTGYFISGSVTGTQSEIEGAGILTAGNPSAGEYATDFASYASWVGDFSVDIVSQVDVYNNNVVDLYNPMNFVLEKDKGGSGTTAYDGATLAKHWRVRHGTTDANSAPVIATLFALALEQAESAGRIESLDFLLPWQGPHGVVEAASDNLSAWVADVWAPERAEIETKLDLANNPDQEWTYNAEYDAWILSVVSAVAYPELPNQQGVSVSVPGDYVTGIDTDGDGTADVISSAYTAPVKGSLVINATGSITNSNGQTYGPYTAPVILNTGAAGYGSQTNSAASATRAPMGYINVTCGNRGKQDSVKDANGDVLYYTGDAPSCLVDQKAATRFVKYNILLGNLPGNVAFFVSTGGSGGAAHASMVAATSNNPDFYDYQIAAGAVGVYKDSAGVYSTAVDALGGIEISDGMWGSIAYSTISSLYEADAAQAFEYYMDTTFSFKTVFQAQLAEYLSEAYMNYINGRNLRRRKKTQPDR
ncbi:MAG: hypothetical protein LBT26_11600 [Clostridiales Family XIII bacterium]|jgi:hypothetical protein|nr:hypothetical protein [Clostridiales Family XIII bacterium]